MRSIPLLITCCLLLPLSASSIDSPGQLLEHFNAASVERSWQVALLVDGEAFLSLAKRDSALHKALPENERWRFLRSLRRQFQVELALARQASPRWEQVDLIEIDSEHCMLVICGLPAEGSVEEAGGDPVRLHLRRGPDGWRIENVDWLLRGIPWSVELAAFVIGSSEDLHPAPWAAGANALINALDIAYSGDRSATEAQLAQVADASIFPPPLALLGGAAQGMLAWIEAGDAAATVKLLAPIHEQLPDNAAIAYVLIQAYNSCDEEEQAAQLARHYLEHIAWDQDIAWTVIRQLEANEPEACLPIYGRMLDHDPDNIDALAEMAQLATGEQGAALLAARFAACSDLPAAFDALVDNLIWAERRDLIPALLPIMAERQPQHPRYLVERLAELPAGETLIAAMITEGRKAIDLGAEGQRELYRLIVIARDRDCLSAACMAMERPAVLLRLLLIIDEKSDLPLCDQLAATVVSADPDNSWVALHRARQAADSSRYDEAFDCLAPRLVTAGEDEQSQYHRMVQLGALVRFAIAAERERELLSADYPDAISQLMPAMRMIGDIERLHQLCLAAGEQGPSDPSGALAFASCQLLAGDADSAASTLLATMRQLDATEAEIDVDTINSLAGNLAILLHDENQSLRPGFAAQRQVLDSLIQDARRRKDWSQVMALCEADASADENDIGIERILAFADACLARDDIATARGMLERFRARVDVEWQKNNIDRLLARCASAERTLSRWINEQDNKQQAIDIALAMLLEQKDYQTIGKLIAHYGEQVPATSSGYYQGRMAEAAGQDDEAITAYQHCLQEGSGGLAWQARRRLVNLMAKHDRLAELYADENGELPPLFQIIEAAERHQRPWRQLAEHHRDQDEPSIWLQLMLAGRFLASGEAKACQEICDTVLDDPDCSGWWRQRCEGLAALARLQNGGTIAWKHELVASAFNELGSAFDGRPETATAQALLASLAEVCEADDLTQRIKLEQLRLAGEHDRALELIAQHPIPLCHGELALPIAQRLDLLCAAGRSDEAITLAKLQFCLDEEFEDWQWQLARIHARRGEVEACARALTRSWADDSLTIYDDDVLGPALRSPAFAALQERWPAP